MTFRVLLVEDNPGDARICELMLRSIPDGYRLTHVETFSEAIEASASVTFDAVLLDLELPDSSGLDTLRHGRSLWPDIPIVVLTGHEDPELGVNLVREGAQDYVPKRNLSSSTLMRSLRYAIERNRFARQLLNADSRYRQIFENAKDAIFTTDLSGMVTSLNRAAVKVAGRTRDQAIGRNVSEVFGFDYADFLSGVLMEAPENRKTTWKVKLPRRSITLSITGSIIYDGADPVGLQAIARDVTERGELEAALRRSEESLLSLFENSPFGIFTKTLSGQILQVNSVAVKMLGYESEQELLKVNVEELYATPSHRRAFIEDAVGKRGETRIETEWKRKDGSRITVRIAGYKITDSLGNVDHIQAFVEDVTQERALESRYRQMQRIESIGRLTGGIAHDFNNILGVIVGYAEMLQEQAAGQTWQIAEEILKASKRGASLIAQLLAFSRQQVLEPKIVNLNSIAEDMDKLIRRLIGEDVLLEMVLAPMLGNIKADRGQLEQVLMNLSINARDAMSTGGRLLIRTENAQLTHDSVQGKLYEVAPGPYVALTVADTGVGMDCETKSRIFDPFFTTKPQGTGLGLSTVYGIVKQSGGFIEVHSAPGEGAAFTILLPRVQGESAEEEKEAAPSGIVGKLTVLLAEDEQILRFLTRQMLLAFGFEVLQAEDGKAALEIAQAYKGAIDLLLTDVVMPRMGGVELAEKLLVLRPAVRTLFMSGYTGQMPRAQSRIPGTGYLQKPFTRSSLLRNIQKVIGTNLALATD